MSRGTGQLRRQIGHIPDTSAVGNVSWNSKKLLIRSRPRNRFSIIICIQNQICSSSALVNWHDDSGAFGVLINVVREIDEGLEVILDCRLRVDDETAPQPVVVEGCELEAGYDAEIVVSTFQDSEEIWVVRLAGGGDTAVGKDHFKFEDIVANQAVLWGEIADAAAQGQSANTDC